MHDQLIIHTKGGKGSKGVSNCHRVVCMQYGLVEVTEQVLPYMECVDHYT